MQHKQVLMSLIASVLLCSCALQDDIYSLDHRLSALEKRNTELEKQNRELEETNRELSVAKDDFSKQVKRLNQTRLDDEFDLRGQYAGLAAQMDSLRKATQLHKGQLEEIDYLLNRKLNGFEETQLNNKTRMDRLATDFASQQKRVVIIEQYLNMEGAAGKKGKKRATPVTKSSKPSSDKALYLSSKKEYDAGNYEAARKGFKKLMKTYPKSEHADNSQFWIGETYYSEKWYEKAILEYQKVIENYPSGNKTPAAMLKQGFSFLNIGEANNARLLLQDLVSKHPGTEEAKKAKRKLESL